MPVIGQFIARFRRRVRKLTNHPLAKRRKLRTLGRYAAYHVTQRLSSRVRAYPFVNDLKLLGETGATGHVSGATGSIFTGLHDFEESGFLLHFLRPTDCFLDAGANVGAYSLLAAGVARCRTVAVEPIPDTFAQLEANVRVNGLEVEAHNCGLGAEPGMLWMTTYRGAMNRIVEAGENTIEVPIQTVDGLMAGATPTLWKLDVEGFEVEVLKGAPRTLEDPNLQALIVELNGSTRRFGSTKEQLHDTLTRHGFTPSRYDPLTRTIHEMDSYNREGTDTIYLRDIDRAIERTASAEPFRVLGQVI